MSDLSIRLRKVAGTYDEWDAHQAIELEAANRLEFNLVEDDIDLPEVCPILKTPFKRGCRRQAYSLDRKDPTKGYTKDNVWVISQLANAMKWDSTHEERLAFANWVLSLEGGL